MSHKKEKRLLDDESSLSEKKIKKKKKDKKKKDYEDDKEDYDTCMRKEARESDTRRINVAEDSAAIDSILKRYRTDASLPELMAMAQFLRRTEQDMQSATRCFKINSQFKLIKERMRNAEVLEVLNRARCTRKEYERADYHVTSSTFWTIDLTGGGTLEFQCYYNGDNEGSGSYSWKCGEDGEEDAEHFDDLTASHEPTWERLGLTTEDNASYFYHCLCECSIS